MVDRLALADQIHRFVVEAGDGVCSDYYHLLEHLDCLVVDQDAQRVAYNALVHAALPVWVGDIAVATPLEKSLHAYAVAGIDGSQVDADHHAGFDCRMTHIGAAIVRYGEVKSSLTYRSITALHAVTADTIDIVRTADECAAVGTVWRSDRPTLIMLDGPLCGDAMQQWSHYYDYWSQEHIPLVGYVSAPRTTFLEDAVRVLCDRTCVREAKHGAMRDDCGMSYIVPAQHRGALWHAPHAIPVSSVYINTGFEIVRVDMPRYLLESDEQYACVVAIIADQIEKGRGYPLCLAEAHLQSVIKESDRQYILSCYRHTKSMQQLLIRQHDTARYSAFNTARISAKLARKRAVPI